MNRIYKSYDFRFNNPHFATQITTFSSYPGLLNSNDDFYIMSSKLVVTETTNDFVDDSLYDKISSLNLYSW